MDFYSVDRQKMPKTVDIIGVQLDKGASRRGVDMGPSAMRYAELAERIEELGLRVRDKGDIVANGYVSGAASEDGTVVEKVGMNNLQAVQNVIQRTYAEVQDSLEACHLPLVIGGDHSLAAGTIMATKAYYKQIGVIWVDAHCDFNDAVHSPSGNLHGMPLSAVCGYGPDELVFFRDMQLGFVDPKNVVIIGARSIDHHEQYRIKEAGVTVFNMTDIDLLGMGEITKRAIEIASHNTQGIHLSFDLDSIDPTFAPGVGTPVPGGLTYREAHLLSELLAESDELIAIEVVELNPILDQRNMTGGLAVELISSLLGKRIIKKNG